MSERLPVGSDLFDALWRELWGRVEEMIDARQATFGTVVGRDGGKVRVRMDDEDEDRVIGFPRSLGVAYEDGDRVRIDFNRDGDPSIGGVISGGNGDGRVKNEQLGTDAVDERAIKPRAIKGGHLDQTLEKKIADAATVDQVDNKLGPYLKTSDANREFAKSSELGQYAKDARVSDLEKKVKELETKIARASKRSNKGTRK